MKRLASLKWRAENLFDYVFVRFLICVLIALPIVFCAILVQATRDCIMGGGSRGFGSSLGTVVFSGIFLVVLLVAVPRGVRYLWHNFVVLDMTMTALLRKYHVSSEEQWRTATQHGPVYFYRPIIEKERRRRDALLKRGVKFRCGRIIRPSRG